MNNQLTKQRHRFGVVGVCMVFGLLVVCLVHLSPPLRAQSGTPLMQRLSVGPAGTPGNANSQHAAISADGNRVVFDSYDTAVPNQTPTTQPGDLGWQTTILDVRGFVGQSADITLDADGHPHIAYNSDNIGRGELRYARWDGFVWHVEVVDEGTSTGEYPSILIGANGQPRIAYYHRAETALKHAERQADGTWQTEIVDSNEDRGRFASMAINPINGVVDIIYHESRGTRLLHVRGPAGLWTFRQVDDSGDVGEDASLARGPNGLLGASYFDRSNTALKYAQWNSSTLSWDTETVDNSGDTGRSTSIAFDSQGRPHISYIETTGFETYSVKHAVRNGNLWTTTTVEADVPFGPTSLVIGVQDLPVIAYRKGGIRLARLKENVWNYETVDNTIIAEGSLALARDDANDREHLVYEDGRYDDLGYAVWAPAWQERVVGTGEDPSLVVRNGRPQILYRKDDAPSSLTHARGNPGPTWGESLVRVGAGASSNPAVLDANGVLHAAFYQSTTRTIFYATLVNGAWTFEEVATLPEGAFFQPNLRLVLSGGEPHVIYTFYTGEVSFHIAYRSNGVWLNSTQPSPRALGTEPNFDALVLDSGALAISYWDAGDTDLRLVTWDGGVWTDTLIDAGPNGAEVGEFNAIARGYDVLDGEVVAEVLAVAYYDRTNQSIRYAYTRPGVGWQATELVADVGSVSDLDLAVAGDTHALPYIVFTTQDYGNNHGDLRLAFSDDNLQTVALETIAEDAAIYGAQPSLVHDNQPRIVYRNADGEIVYTFPTARRAVPAPVHNDGLTGAGVLYGAGLDLVVCLYVFMDPAARSLDAMDELSAVLPDGQVMARMTSLFGRSQGGQRYLALTWQHAQEMAVIARSDPSLLWDGHRVMQNFMPGLEAWVSGRGDEFIVTQQMVDDALDIWQRIAAQAGPELSAAINAELAATNNLQNFVGDSFDQWAAEIGVDSGAKETIFLPLVQK